MDAQLLNVQEGLGAVCSDDRSWALHFGDAEAETQAARSDCALFDLSQRTQIEITGNDRATFLHNFCTNDITALKPGAGCEAFVTNVKGRVLGHIFVFVGSESIWLESVAGVAAELMAHLDRYVITEDVVMADRSEEWGELFVAGPTSRAKLAECGIEVDLSPYGHSTIDWQGEPMSVRRIDMTGDEGYLLSVQTKNLADLWSRLAKAGITSAGRTAFEVLRIEAGMPAYGIDISDENLAQEVSRTKQAVSFTKGCYLGQEPIARLDALGHVNRELRGLRFSAPVLLEAGTDVLAADGNDVIGRVTSSAQLSVSAAPVALAYVKSGHATPGTAVSVKPGDEPISATVFWNA